MPTCGGCRTCEIACSFHHREEFNPTISSIQIVNRMNEPGFVVSLVEEKDGDRVACDFCKALEVPLCVVYCKEKDELAQMIKGLEQRKGVIADDKGTGRI